VACGVIEFLRAEIAGSLKKSCAVKVQILLGRAYFQTEPDLILRLKQLQEAGSATKPFEVKLASAVATFHPKVWIIDDDHDGEPVADLQFRIALLVISTR
jgi:hypothetical protein